jgi:hypothetical protein
MSKNTVFYIARDIERALGMEPSEIYQIVTNDTPYARSVQKKYPDFVHPIESSDELLDTRELLAHDTTKTLIAKGACIVVFKNTATIEQTCIENGWKLLNPSSILGEKIENKTTQIEYLGELGERYLPLHSLKPAKDIIWEKKPLIVQWAHSHTGDGTILVNSEEDLKNIQKTFPERPARVTAYVHGPSFTLNIAVSNNSIAFGNISYQITGLPPFTENPFTTIGNDWSLTHSLLNEHEIASVEEMARDIGTKLQKDGWRGLFGIDMMRDDELDKIFLIEINARQPASTTYESQLQMSNRSLGMTGSTIFEAHMATLQGASVSQNASTETIRINDGAQIIQRITRLIQSISPLQIQQLETAGYSTITYENKNENEDALRIQSTMGIMETHGKLNKRGQEILNILNEH